MNHVILIMMSAVIALAGCGGSDPAKPKPPRPTQKMALRFDPRTGIATPATEVDARFDRYKIGPCIPNLPDGTRLERRQLFDEESGRWTVTTPISEGGTMGDPPDLGHGHGVDPPPGIDDERCIPEGQPPPPPSITYEVDVSKGDVNNVDVNNAGVYHVEWDAWDGAKTYELTIKTEDRETTLYHKADLAVTEWSVPADKLEGFGPQVVVSITAMPLNGKPVPYEDAILMLVSPR